MATRTSSFDVGENIRRTRRREGLTQEKVAEKLGLSRHTIIRTEKGQRPIHADELRRFAELFHVDVSSLVTAGPAPDLPAEETWIVVNKDEAGLIKAYRHNKFDTIMKLLLQKLHHDCNL